MLVGPTGGGKTKIFRCLRTALDKTMGITHKDSRFNPKAIRAQEMYGEVDPATGEWNTGDSSDLAISLICRLFLFQLFCFSPALVAAKWPCRHETFCLFSKALFRSILTYLRTTVIKRDRPHSRVRFRP